MNDEQTIRGELDRLAAGDPLGPIDSARLLDRGRRGRRRRRLLASGGTVAALTAAALTAALLPGLGGAASFDDQSTAAASQVDPHEMVTEAEALERCRRQWSKDAGREIGQARTLVRVGAPPTRTYRVHSALAIDDDDKPGFYVCSIPGGGENRPGRIMPPQPLEKVDPAIQVESGASNAAVLRACSAKLARIKAGTGGHLGRNHHPPSRLVATDVTGWRVVARMDLARIGTTIVAVSPSGEFAAKCDLYVPGVPQGYNWSSMTAAYRIYPNVRDPHLPQVLQAGGLCLLDLRQRCTGWMSIATGRVSSKIDRIRIEARNGRSVDVPVNDGWFAVMWADGNPNGQPNAKVTAFDAAGKVVPAR